MNYLLESQIKPHLHHSKEIEQFLGQTSKNDFAVLIWITIEHDKRGYRLLLHEVFDDRDEGLESIYHFSYFHEDNVFGKELKRSNDLTELLKYATEELGASNLKYSLPGNLDDHLK